MRTILHRLPALLAIAVAVCACKGRGQAGAADVFAGAVQSETVAEIPEGSVPEEVVSAREDRALRRHRRDSIRAERARERERTTLVDTLKYNAILDSLAAGDTTGRWPAKGTPYPYKGAILPFHRIVAYYGNLYSKRMGVLGEYAPDTLWQMLRSEVAAWEKADPSMPVIPAIHYIASTAQGTPGRDKMYRMRMPAKQIDSALSIAAMGDAIVFLDVQVAHSTVQKEVPVLEEYLKLPHVHLAVDPEFAMHNGVIPGKKIGTLDAAQINWCAEYLSKIVQENHLPPKILVVHRFTEGMVTNASAIRPLPEVQIVMDMDGWGSPALKKNTYRQCIYKAPVQFAGFKLFYKNDLRNPPYRMLTPDEVLDLTPKPVYIQYQ